MARPPPQGLEERLCEEARSGMLHPDVDDTHYLGALRAMLVNGPGSRLQQTALNVNAMPQSPDARRVQRSLEPREFTPSRMKASPAVWVETGARLQDLPSRLSLGSCLARQRASAWACQCTHRSLTTMTAAAAHAAIDERSPHCALANIRTCDKGGTRGFDVGSSRWRERGRVAP